MLPLLAETTPATAAELATALTRGIQQMGITPRAIEATGASLAEMQILSIDLSGARLGRDFRPSALKDGDGPTICAAQFSLLASPIHFEQAPVELKLVAQKATAKLAMTDGRGSLLLESAESGNVSAQMRRSDLEALVHSFAVEAASKHGLDVRKTSLSFVQEGPLTVAFRAEVTAKVFVMSATLALTGRLTIDERLNARLSDLRLDGDGMILKLAGGYARPYLDRLDGRVFPLLAFSPGGLKLREVELLVGDDLVGRARFGSA